MIVDQILKFIKYKGISKSKFYKETGLSNGFLDKVKDIGHSKLLKILSTYPEINPIWLILGKGEMIIKSKSFSLKEEEFKDHGDKEKNIYLSVEEVISRNVVKKIIPILSKNHFILNEKIDDIIKFIDYAKLFLEIDNQIAKELQTKKKNLN